VIAEVDVIWNKDPVGGPRRIQERGYIWRWAWRGLVDLFKPFAQNLWDSVPWTRQDMLWDYPAFWTGNERHGFIVFCDIITRGMYLNNWGSFVEQWFILENFRNINPVPTCPGLMIGKVTPHLDMTLRRGVNHVAVLHPCKDDTHKPRSVMQTQCIKHAPATFTLRLECRDQNNADCAFCHST
jgi:hypothetical protein